MTRILLKNATIVTLDKRDEVLPDTDLAIEEGRILALGDPPGDWLPDERHDLSGHVIIPAMWNAHTHAAMTFTRSIGDDLPLDRWFNERVWVAESGLTAEDVYWGSQLAMAEMIRGGAIGFADHYFHMDRVRDGVAASGMKALLATAVFGQDEVRTDFDEALDQARTWNERDGRIRTVLGPHSPYICSPAFLEKVARAAQEAGLGIHIHVAESEEQVRVSLEKNGRTPVAHLAALGIFDVPTLAAHCIAVSEEDLAILAARQVFPVQCPRCHCRLGMGTTPVAAMTASGIQVALGTDGAASNNRLHMLAEMQLSPMLARLEARDATLLPGDLPLRMASLHGARAMGFTDSGQIRPGMAADLTILDFRAPHLQPVHSVIGNLIAASHVGDIVHVMANGRWLMFQQTLRTLDEAEILKRAQPMARAMCRRGKEQMRRYEG